MLVSPVDSVASSETQQHPFAFCHHVRVVAERKLHGACEESMPRAVGCGDVGAPSVSSWRKRTRHGGVCILKLVIIHWNMFILFPIVFAMTLFVCRSTWRRLPHHTPPCSLLLTPRLGLDIFFPACSDGEPKLEQPCRQCV